MDGRIHKFNLNNRNIVLDINSGAVHVVDDVYTHILDYYSTRSLEEIIDLLKDRFDKYY